jgi:O-antigen ligase
MFESRITNQNKRRYDHSFKEKFDRVLYDLKSFHTNEHLLLLSIVSLFLPYQYSAACLALLLVWLLIKKELIADVKKQKGAPFLYAFIFLEIAVSAFYGNMVGLINSAGFLLIGLYIAFYRQTITPKLFHYVIHIYVGMSLFAAAYGLFEFEKISARNGYSFFDFVIEDAPKDRINSTFKNANFYATMIDYFLIFCTFEFLRDKNKWKRLYYLLAALLNFFMLILTGCRAALIPFIFIIPIFLWYHKRKKLFAASVAVEGIGACFIALRPELIPRIDDVKSVNSRFQIWSAALKAIPDHLFFGMGPQTYGFIYKSLNAKKAPHAHNIYIDAILSYGIVGTAIGLGYFFTLFKEILAVRNNKQVPLFFPMIICFILSALIHGLLDCTLNFLVTGTTFMIVINSACMYTHQKN